MTSFMTNPSIATLLYCDGPVLLYDSHTCCESRAPKHIQHHVEISFPVQTTKKVHFAPLPEKHQAPYTAARISKRKRTRRLMNNNYDEAPNSPPQEADRDKSESTASSPVSFNSMLTNSNSSTPGSPGGNNDNVGQQNAVQPIAVQQPLLPHGLPNAIQHVLLDGQNVALQQPLLPDGQPNAVQQAVVDGPQQIVQQQHHHMPVPVPLPAPILPAQLPNNIDMNRVLDLGYDILRLFDRYLDRSAHAEERRYQLQLRSNEQRDQRDVARRNHELKLTELKLQVQLQQVQARENHVLKLVELKQQRQEQQAAHELKIEELKRQRQEQQERAKEAHELKMEELKRQQQEQQNNARECHELKLEERRSQLREQQKKARESHELKLEEPRMERQEQQDTHKLKMIELKRQRQEQQERAKEAYELKMIELKRQRQEQQERAKEAHELKMEELKRQRQEQQNNARESHELKLEELRMQRQAQQDKVKESHDLRMLDHEHELRELGRAILPQNTLLAYAIVLVLTAILALIIPL